METRDEFFVEKALINYKEIGGIIIDKLVNNDYDALKELFALREQELIRIRQLPLENHQLKNIYEDLKIEALDNKIRLLIDDKKKSIVKERDMLGKKSSAAIKYKKNYNSFHLDMFYKK